MPWARLRLIGSSSSATRVSGDTVRVDAEGAEETGADAGDSGQRVLESELRVVLGDDVRFEGFGATGGLAGSLQLRQLAGEPVAGEGVIELVGARYQAYGQDLRVRRGRIIFSGPMGDPRLDIEAVRESERVLAGLRIDGSARSPGVTLFSTPPMEQVDILAYLLTGRPPGEDSASETALLGQAALSLGVLGGDRVGQALAEELGIEGFQLEASGEGEDAQVAVSGYIAPNLLIRYGVGVFEPDNTLSLRYYLSSQFYLEAISGTENALDIFYTFDYD